MSDPINLQWMRVDQTICNPDFRSFKDQQVKRRTKNILLIIQHILAMKNEIKSN